MDPEGLLLQCTKLLYGKLTSFDKGTVENHLEEGGLHLWGSTTTIMWVCFNNDKDSEIVLLYLLYCSLAD